MTEYEDCAMVKFGGELTEEQKKDFRRYVETYSRSSDVDWYKERIDD